MPKTRARPPHSQAIPGSPRRNPQGEVGESAARHADSATSSKRTWNTYCRCS
ncbi:hypothetical protein ACFXPW_34910 [Streptomyces goshikiensis]|uniref:hypothetical protein n=1 Tax=Streptomyces goshikiensis TaxID=1942 RepID=UPI00367C96C8